MVRTILSQVDNKYVELSIVCRICGDEKPLEAFGPAKSKESTAFNANVVPELKRECRSCLAHQAREWRARNRGYNGSGRFSKYPKEERKVVSAICMRIGQAKSNNKRNNRPFNITLEYMYALWKAQQGRCKYTNQELFIEKDRPATLSIDKIQPELGYVEGNV